MGVASHFASRIRDLKASSTRSVGYKAFLKRETQHLNGLSDFDTSDKSISNEKYLHCYFCILCIRCSDQQFFDIPKNFHNGFSRCLASIIHVKLSLGKENTRNITIDK